MCKEAIKDYRAKHNQQETKDRRKMPSNSQLRKNNKNQYKLTGGAKQH